MAILTKNSANGITYQVNIYLPQNLRIQYGKDRIYKTFSNLKEAEKWERAKNKEIESGYITFSEIITMENAATLYLNQIQHTCSPSTMSTMRGYVRNYFIPVFQNKPLNKLTPLDIQKFNSFIKTLPDKSEKTKHNISSSLRALLKWAKSNNYIDEDLIDDISKYSQKTINTRDFLTIEEVKYLISLIDSDLVKDLVTFMVFTGMRISEVCGLRFNDINFERRMLTVSKQIYFTTTSPEGYILIPPKCNNISSIYLNDLALNILIKRHSVEGVKPVDFVFSDHNGYPLRKDGYIRNQFDKAIQKMKAEGYLDHEKQISFHCLRHTYASMLVHMNENIYTVQHLLRHKDFRLTYNTYAHMYPNHQPASFGAINNEFNYLMDNDNGFVGEDDDE